MDSMDEDIASRSWSTGSEIRFYYGYSFTPRSTYAIRNSDQSTLAHPSVSPLKWLPQNSGKGGQIQNCAFLTSTVRDCDGCVRLELPVAEASQRQQGTVVRLSPDVPAVDANVVLAVEAACGEKRSRQNADALLDRGAMQL